MWLISGMQKVKITAMVKVSDIEHTLEETVDIYQVRRLVNPKRHL